MSKKETKKETKISKRTKKQILIPPLLNLSLQYIDDPETIIKTFKIYTDRKYLDREFSNFFKTRFGRDSSYQSIKSSSSDKSLEEVFISTFILEQKEERIKLLKEKYKDTKIVDHIITFYQRAMDLSDYSPNYIYKYTQDFFDLILSPTDEELRLKIRESNNSVLQYSIYGVSDSNPYFDEYETLFNPYNDLIHLTFDYINMLENRIPEFVEGDYDNVDGETLYDDWKVYGKLAFATGIQRITDSKQHLNIIKYAISTEDDQYLTELAQFYVDQKKKYEELREHYKDYPEGFYDFENKFRGFDELEENYVYKELIQDLF